MKRFMTLMTVLVLCLSLAAAAAAEEGVSFATRYFTMTLPEGWETDFEDLEKEEDYEELGYAFSPDSEGLCISACLLYEEELNKVALWNEDEEGLKEYLEMLIETLEEEKAEGLEPVMAGRIPFVLLKSEDDDGPYLMAETVTNGYIINFMAYRMDGEAENFLECREEDVAQFRSILESFLPVT